MKINYILFAVIFFLIVYVAFNSLKVEAPKSPGRTLGAKIGLRTKSSGCASVNALPDSACTPGAVIADASLSQICTPGYSKSVRNVPSVVKDEVYREYGITSHYPGQYEVDHLISLELGGSNDLANLWPEPSDPRPGFHEKDKVENYLHDQVCNHGLDLGVAQQKIASDWLEFYNQLP